MRYSFSVVVLILTIEALSANDNWPQFRGPTGDGLCDARDVPTTWSETENIRWKTAIQGKAWSSPVVWGDQVWVTTATADGKEYFAVCVDRKSGKIVHDLKLFTEEKPQFCIDFNSYASCTPVIEDGRFYAHFGRYGTACVDTATGKTLWENRELKCDHWRGPGSSAILYGKLLILTFDGYDVQFVAALDKSNGKLAWKKERNIQFPDANGDLHKAYSTPSVLELNGKPQLVSPAAEATIAYDPITGNELWRFIHSGMNEAAKPVFGHGMIYLNNGHKKTLFAVRQGGSGLLSDADVVWTTKKSVPSRPSLLLIGDYLYMVDDQGIASCLDAKTGEFKWNERPGKEQSGSPVAAGGHIFIADQEGTTSVIEANPTYKLVALNKLKDGCMASPAIVDGAIFIRTKTHLYCIGR
jgi:outer membrane protein assembly factor BamB